MLDGHVFTAPDMCKGFDANSVISRAHALEFYKAGYRFAVRYVRRSTKHEYDLKTQEAKDIISAGLGLMVVQHVADEGWSPNGGSGRLYGTTASLEAEAIGIPPGVTLWCDLEGVAPASHYKDVVEYCKNWHAAVAMAGYLPGLYVGFNAGLTADQLYRNLPFTHYWAAYNLNADRFPAVRGVQMRQHAAKPSELIPGFTNQNLDVDEIHTDKNGGRPTLLAGADWLTELSGSSR